ncbi:beta-ketoacyl synthase N-terminal-like domain-containing protein [Hymenobacter sp. YC55]|uniref:beta-ketoacyl synthase N-terminal-like domain-containing protein n=1 Tax=Hymenobacter sp. YC55 TaxID=3034019 RepID=UPI0023F6A0BC|nr:beta-ketoacyl synthase N-terminal-like domain-containing protein [Hymenobacter sp. YC55]MDF7810815.1 beta-ketoacyl synthase N-terminal-like domain-containing protein [Hymenobacter sp. YC55]
MPNAEGLIVIRGRGRACALGTDLAAYSASETSPFQIRSVGAHQLPVAALPATTEEAVAALRRAHPAYRQLDRTVLLALLAARQSTAEAGWVAEAPSTVVEQVAAFEVPVGNNGLTKAASSNNTGTLNQQASVTNQQPEISVSIGSSRGATERLEQFHREFLADGVVPVAASPLTTLGNVASWVAFDAGSTGGAALSHSSTCSSAFQALGNAVAWLRAGMASRFLAGGTEAPLTDFTLTQMHTLGIYSTFPAIDWPCRPGAGRPSSFVLGEGAAVFALEKVDASALTTELRQPGQPVFVLEAVGFGFEAIASKTGLSPDGQHFQQAIGHALRQAGRTPTDIDAVVLHSPGTPAGDASERAALRAVFGEELPPLLSNKWLVGHTLGASAALSLDFALHVLATQQWLPVPFATDLAPAPTRPIRRILVNAAGFGGNAASVLVSML